MKAISGTMRQRMHSTGSPAVADYFSPANTSFSKQEMPPRDGLTGAPL
jgi:hypothetical protein